MTDLEIEEEQDRIDTKDKLKACKKFVEMMKEIIENDGHIEDKYEEIKFYVNEIFEEING